MAFLLASLLLLLMGFRGSNISNVSSSSIDASFARFSSGSHFREWNILNKILHASFSLSFHTYFLVERRMTQETPKASAFNYYIFQRLMGVVAIESEYLFSFSVEHLDATQFRGGSRNFSPGGSKLWFGKLGLLNVLVANHFSKRRPRVSKSVNAGRRWRGKYCFANRANRS